MRALRPRAHSSTNRMWIGRARVFTERAVEGIATGVHRDGTQPNSGVTVPWLETKVLSSVENAGSHATPYRERKYHNRLGFYRATKRRRLTRSARCHDATQRDADLWVRSLFAVGRRSPAGAFDQSP